MKYRKKPVVVEAIQFFPETADLPFQEMGAPIQFGCECRSTESCFRCQEFWIQTSEGRMIVSAGDYVIRGIKGEFYPCKPDIFEATYEPADED
jgi:hypothetical protein